MGHPRNLKLLKQRTHHVCTHAIRSSGQHMLCRLKLHETAQKEVRLFSLDVAAAVLPCDPQIRVTDADAPRLISQEATKRMVRSTT